MRVDDLTADFLSAVAAFKGGTGLSVFDTTVVAAASGAGAELRRFTTNAVLPDRTGMRILAVGDVTNNATVKTVRLSFNTFPINLLEISPAINTANLWAFDVLLYAFSGQMLMFAQAFTGPSASAPTATAVRYPTGTIAVPGGWVIPQSFLISMSAGNAGDVTHRLLIVSPVVSPS